MVSVTPTQEAIDISECWIDHCHIAVFIQCLLWASYCELNNNLSTWYFSIVIWGLTGVQREEKFPSCVGEEREFYFEISVYFSLAPTFIWISRILKGSRHSLNSFLLMSLFSLCWSTRSRKCIGGRDGWGREELQQLGAGDERQLLSWVWERGRVHYLLRWGD